MGLFTYHISQAQEDEDETRKLAGENALEEADLFDGTHNDTLGV